MRTWALLAPGPSASKAVAESLRGFPLGVVGNAFELAPWADFLAASDAAWWRLHPAARGFTGNRFAMHEVPDVQRVKVPGTVCVNSGVLALECAKRAGATRVLLLGFDQRGSHFFGPYTNGLGNTTEQKRKMHLAQFIHWRKANPAIAVVNCTPGSALKCFPMGDLSDELSRIPKAERVNIITTASESSSNAGAILSASSASPDSLDLAVSELALPVAFTGGRLPAPLPIHVPDVVGIGSRR